MFRLCSFAQAERLKDLLLASEGVACRRSTLKRQALLDGRASSAWTSYW